MPAIIQRIDQILARAREITEAATPDVEPSLRYRHAPYTAPLSKLAFGSDPRDGTRRFHVVPAILRGSGALDALTLNGLGVHYSDEIVVEVRYCVPLRSDQGYQRLGDLVSSDIARISTSLIQEFGQDPPGEGRVDTIDPRPATLETISQNEPVYILVLPFAIRYWVA